MIDQPDELPTLRRVISAGAPVPAKIIERMAARLEPPAQVYTPYGATEALPVASIGSDEILGETRHAHRPGLGRLRRPAGRRDRGPGHPHHATTRSRSGPTTCWSPTATIGEIVVAGPGRDPRVLQSPRGDPAGQDRRPGAVARLSTAWATSAIATIRGRIWFCGRKSHRVVLPDETLFTIPCEAIFNTHPEVARSALVGVTPRRQTSR